MAVTVGGTSITFNDGTVQTTAAGGAPTTAQVLSATAGASVGAVGSYATLSRPYNSNGTSNPGATLAGSSLRYAGAVSDGASGQNVVSTTAPAGTWRCMGYTTASSGCVTWVSVTLWLRIS